MSHHQRNRSSSPPIRRRSRSRSPPHRHLPSFPSHHSVPSLSPHLRHLCTILSSPSSTPSSTLSLLNTTSFPIIPSDVESVLRLSYSHPSAALTFFRWAGERHLNHSHSPYSWNLVVDLLGKNKLFNAMWDSVISMRDLNILSVSTFASVFSSLAEAGKPAEALATFMSLPKYGIKRDTFSLNSLLSALCRAGLTVDGRAVMKEAQKMGARPDKDSFAILLEGCENERDDIAALTVLDDMVATLGWESSNTQAYDSFLLATISSSPNGARESLHFLELMRAKHCSPGPKFLKSALQSCILKSDGWCASLLWKEYVRNCRSFVVDVEMCNEVIKLMCEERRFEEAVGCFEEMVSRGAFPDAETYSILFAGLLKGRKLKEAFRIFTEMTKNEFIPTESSLQLGLKLSIDEKDPEVSINYFLCISKHKMKSVEESGNLLVVGLCEMDSLPEACKYVEIMIDEGIKVKYESLGKLKKGLEKVRKDEVIERILKKWRRCQK